MSSPSPSSSSAVATASAAPTARQRWRQRLAELPIFSSAAMGLACTPCLAAWGGLLAAAGFGLGRIDPALSVLGLAFAGLALAGLVYGALRMRFLPPLLLGVAGVAVFVAARFWLNSTASETLWFSILSGAQMQQLLYYAAIGLLFGGSLWNQQRLRAAPCEI